MIILIKLKHFRRSRILEIRIILFYAFKKMTKNNLEKELNETMKILLKRKKIMAYRKL